MTATPRQYHQYVRQLLSRNISYLDGATPAGTPTTGIQVSFGFAVPKNAIVVRIGVIVTTAFNAATTNTIDVGTLASGVALISAGALTLGTTISSPATLQGLLSSTAAVEVFTRYNFTGAVPTAGAGRVFVEYINDPQAFL